MCKRLYKSDTFGGSGGNDFNDYYQQSRSVGIKSVQIRHGKQVDMIDITYILYDGTTWDGGSHGGTGGSLSTFSLKKGDCISKIEGKINNALVGQLTFTVTTSTGSTVIYGPYGTTGSQSFSVQGQVASFFGNSDSLLNAVGVYYC